MNKFILFSSVLTFILSIHLDSVLSAKFTLATKGLKCFEVNPKFIEKHTCRIFAKKGTLGLVYGDFYVKNVKHVSASLQTYRKTTIKYLPWAFKVTVDCCELVRNFAYDAWRNILVGFIVASIENAYPSLFESGCPYQGRYESTKADLNATVSPLFPPIMPTGQFKLSFHFYETLTNETIFKADVEFIIKQTIEFRAMDFDF